jgi:hypothetical protein
MAADIHQITLTNLAAFNNLIAYHPDTVEEIFNANLQESIAQVQEVQQALDPNPGVVLQELLNALNGCIRTCTLCNRPLHPEIPQVAFQRSNYILPGLKRKPRGEDTQREDEERASEEENLANTEKSAAYLNRHYHVKDRKNAVMGRHPRPTPPPELPSLETLKGLRIPADDQYDEYETGPTLQALDPIPDTIALLGEINLVYLANQVVSNPWVTFRDYGYRLEPDFTQAFHLPPPVMVMEHLMPVGLEAASEGEEDSTQKSRRGEDINIPDVEVMGAKDMILEAKREKSNDIFLTGKTREGQLIKLNLQRDAVTPTSIEKAVDIDSLIWVTRYPRFKHAISIFTKPVIRNRAPIYKHNHVYVELLVPQSEEDQLHLGARNEWFSKTFKLNQIPHVQFGKLGDGAGSVNLFMAFPRMTHKHPYIPRWVNIIPGDVQNLLWDKVITPAMKAVMPEMNHPYVGLNRAHLAFKEKQKGASKSTPTFPFRKDEFSALTNEIQRMVSHLIFYNFL